MKQERVMGSLEKIEQQKLIVFPRNLSKMMRNRSSKGFPKVQFCIKFREKFSPNNQYFSLLYVNYATLPRKRQKVIDFDLFYRFNVFSAILKASN
jgi:hypothetical protein